MSKLMTALEEVQNHLNAVKEDAAKFENGNATAGTRVRTGSMAIIKRLKEVRVLVSDMKNK